jgi:CheY-like chemotaxis protein
MESRNLLIVEDDEEWCEVYARAAKSQASPTVRIAEDLARASHLIEEMMFAVAFVDIGLNVADDQNIDGLRVMEKIRAVGDNTSIVVVTGRSGQDVLPIMRDSFKKYDAFEIVAKRSIGPQQVKQLLHDGLTAFELEYANSRMTARDALRGGHEPLNWDSQLLTATGVTGGAKGLYEFIERLLAGFLPMLPRVTAEPSTIDSGTGILHGEYWSRAIGKPIALCFGNEETARAEIEAAKVSGTLLGVHRVIEFIREGKGHGLRGGVFTLSEAARSDFESSP